MVMTDWFLKLFQIKQRGRCFKSTGSLSVGPSKLKWRLCVLRALAGHAACAPSTLLGRFSERERNGIPPFLRARCPHTVINKLLVWMGNISKELEVTESEIEALEIELKSLITESGKTCPCPAASSSLLGECVAKPCEELVAATNIIPRPSSLLLDSSGDMIVERADGGLVGKWGQAGDEDVGSPGTATSKFVGLLSSTKGAAMSDPVICGDVNSSKSGNFEMKCSLHGSNEETTCCASSSEVGYQLIASKSSAPQVGMSSQCYSDDMLYDQIVASNKGSASRASEVLDKLLPSRTRSFCSWASNAMIQEKFVKRKRFLKFRERVITLLFRAMQHLRKEDMRLLSIKKNQAKSQKRSELILCTQNGSYQKHRSSIRSRFASPGSSAWVRGFCSESTDPRVREIFETKHLEFLEKIYERQIGYEINEVSMKKYLDIFLKLCRLEFPHFLRWIEDEGLRVSTGSHLENRKPVGRIAWLRPPVGFVKVNVDGSYFEGQEGCNGGGGIAIRDCLGAVEMLYSVSFQGMKNSYHAELEALHLASFLSIRFNYKNVIFESDRLDMIRAIKSGEDIPNDFFEEFLTLPFHLLDDYEASYIPREGNSVADILATGAGRKHLWNRHEEVLALALKYSRQDLQRLPYYRVEKEQQERKGSNGENRRIWVGNLRDWMDENYLRSCFASTCEVAFVKVIRDRLSGLAKGYGFVEFSSHAAADEVLKNFAGKPMPNTGEPFHLNWAKNSEKVVQL